MNSSAIMRQRITGLLIVALVALIIGPALWLARRGPPLPRGEVSTLYLADPIELTDGDTTLRVTRVVLHPRQMRLTLEQDELTFDDYGDPTRVGGVESQTRRAEFIRDFGQDTFTIVPTRRFKQRLRLVALTRTQNTYRLIVLGKNEHSNAVFERILELRGPEIVPDELGDAPQPDRFHFSTLGHQSNAGNHRLSGIHVFGSLETGGHLRLDPNGYMFGPDGHINGSTLLGYDEPKVTFKPLGLDPAQRGRRAFELVPKKAGSLQSRSYILVLGPTELSEHRLVIKTDGRVRQVLRLQNVDRDNHLGMSERFKILPAEERDAYRELGKFSSYRAKAISDNKNIYSVHSMDGDPVRFEPILVRFPHLNELGFSDAKLSATGLPFLERLNGVSAISFWSSELSDEGLRSVGKATGLKRLIIFGSKGPTATGLAHLAPLTKLEMFEIRREDEPPDGPLLDDGLKHLTGMKRLTYLNLQGQKITDAGLVHIGKLTTLQRLYISGPTITEDGLKHLEGLTNLTEFTLYNSRISWEKLTAFRAKMPNLKKW